MLISWFKNPEASHLEKSCSSTETGGKTFMF